MSQKTSADYIRDMLKELADIRAFTDGGRAIFDTDLKAQKAVIRSYEVIGEIAKRLPQTVRDQYPAIDWRKLINFRDFLAHNYEKVSVRSIWLAIEDVSNLQVALDALLIALGRSNQNPHNDGSEAHNESD